MEASKLRNQALVFVGAPGCGKGTQAKLLKVLGKHLSSGSILVADPRTSSIVADRKLVPDDLFFKVVKPHIISAGADGGFLILDGFLRTAAQVVVLVEILADMGYEVSVLAFEIEDYSVLMPRLAGRAQVEQRVDDGDDGGIHQRIGEFVVNLYPIAREVQRLKLRHTTVNADQSVDDVQHSVLEKVAELFGSKTMSASN